MGGGIDNLVTKYSFLIRIHIIRRLYLPHSLPNLESESQALILVRIPRGLHISFFFHYHLPPPNLPIRTLPLLLILVRLFLKCPPRLIRRIHLALLCAAVTAAMDLRFQRCWGDGGVVMDR
jgi:hypothetical protein